MASNREFADYCCELLASVGPCLPKRMFGGWGISVEGLTIAIIADMGSGEKLWLKADNDTRANMEAAGCERFTYNGTKDGQPVSRSMNYYSAPEEAMESSHAMAPWARQALECALKAAQAPVKYARAAPKNVAKRMSAKGATKSATVAKVTKVAKSDSRLKPPASPRKRLP